MKATDLISNAEVHVKKGVTMATEADNAAYEKNKTPKPEVIVQMDFNGMKWGDVCKTMERGVIVPLQNAYRVMDDKEAKAWLKQLPTDEDGNVIVTVKVKDPIATVFERPKTTEEKLADAEQAAEDMTEEELQAYIKRLQEKAKAKKQA